MRLARRAHIVALVMLMLCAVASAQAQRDERDPRNQSPAVGTGGQVPGPTGLFTIYDGDTLRKGEFTFSVAISDYHRDPGNVHFQDYPGSFNVGLNNHIELFFSTIGYRVLKVDTPQNLSSFYLPNSQLFFGPGQLGSGAAIVLPPTGPNVGQIATFGTLFRPAFNQPFVQFPFVGGSAGTYGQGPGQIGGIFGFPGFNATLGPGFGSSATFGAAGSFPGIGSPAGSLLPGIVLSTFQLPCTALTGNCRPPGQPGSLNPITIPVVYTTSPSYLPDAPWINRLSGESAFGTFVVGAKIRLTGPNNALGVGVIPFYRFYRARNANDATNFADWQEGASPGGSIGDFGVTAFISGRLSKHVNLSVNSTFILNSNPKSNALGGTNLTLLDRPNEWITGLGIDFPVNKHFQPIGELTSVRYVGGRTPNALQNNPIDMVVGGKIYPKRWFGIGLAYRRHLNPQDIKHIQATDSNLAFANLSGVFVPGRGIIIVPGSSVPQTQNGIPIGFNPSDDPNGFIGQVFFGHRNARAPQFLPNQPPVIASFTASSATITLPCDPGTASPTCQASASQTVQLATAASDPDGDTLLYTYSVTGGKVTGEGPNVSWDLSGVNPGSYTATVEVDDGCGCVAFTSTTVTIAKCTGCVPPCPTITMSCPDTVDAGAPATLTANVAGGAPGITPTYNWSVSIGTIASGQGTSSITVDTKGLGGQTVTATVEVGGLAPECQKTASCTVSVKGPPPVPTKFDEYGNIRFNDEKARLDNFAIELQNQPTTQGLIIAYGSCEGEAQARADRAKGYLVNTRAIGAERVVTVDGGCRQALTVQLWLVPQGATAPAPDTSLGVTPCPDCKARKHRPARRRGARRGDDEEEEE
jgi:hypothetical protein